MRITNSMINKSSMSNMNANKVNVNRLNTQMTTQKKISRPSEDPVVAIRALRFRSDLSEVNQYYEKNIPDAESWLDLTETALENMKDIVTEVYKQCVKGATDTLQQEDRKAILQNLQALRDQLYKEGNADNAGRTIFTGYKTSSSLTFLADEADTTYEITEKMSFSDIEEKKYYSNLVNLPADENGLKTGVAVDELPQEVSNYRIRISYAGLTGTSGETTDIELTMKDEDGQDVPLTYSAAGGQQQVIAKTMSYADWEAVDFAVGDDETLFIPETGELIFGKNVSEGLKADKTEFSISYSKTGFAEGEIRPEHYFDCKNVSNPAEVISYTKEDQTIEYTIAFNQTITVNTQASDVFDASMGRDVDELTDIVENAIAAHEKVDKIKEMQKQEQYASDEAQAYLAEWLEAAEKEATYADENMQKAYSKGVDDFQKYLDDIAAAITDVGSKGDRVALTKTRVSNQQTNLKELKSNNEDRDLSEVIVDYTSAYTAYQASLMASSKINQQNLLNYL